jgi:cytochrome c oxidase subunit 1
MLGEGMGKVNFWLMFIGFNMIFFPMHELGLKGMPRRVYTYLPETGWGNLNLFASVGAVVMTFGVLAFLANVYASLRAGALAGDNPWDADTLEWGTASPPPDYNFANLPTVEGRNALWEQTQQTPIVVGLSTECREVLCTHIMDAEPDHRYELPGPSVFPFLLSIAVGVAFTVGIFTPWAFPASAVLSAAALYGWFWSDRNSKNTSSKIEAGGSMEGKVQRLPTKPVAPKPVEGEA